MATPIKWMKIAGQTAGSDLNLKLANLGNVAIANAFRNIANWFITVAMGGRSFKGFVFSDGVAASNTVTFSAFVNLDTVTVNGVVFTGRTVPVANTDFGIGATDTITAANFAKVLSGTGSFGVPPAKVWGILFATSATNVATLTAVEPGAIGNLYTLAISAHGSVGGALFTLGADGTIVALAKGL